MLGENGLTCGNRLMTLCDATSMTASSGVKLEHTKAYLPSGPNIVMPGPLASSIRRISFIRAGSITDT